MYGPQRSASAEFLADLHSDFRGLSSSLLFQKCLPEKHRIPAPMDQSILARHCPPARPSDRSRARQGVSGVAVPESIPPAGSRNGRDTSNCYRPQPYGIYKGRFPALRLRLRPCPEQFSLLRCARFVHNDETGDLNLPYRLLEYERAVRRPESPAVGQPWQILPALQA